MMTRKGFILMEILIGFTFLGLIAVASLPAMTFARKNIGRASAKGDMVYLAELAAERLKTDDAEILLYIEELVEEGECIYLDQKINNDHYQCTLIINEFAGEYLSFDVIFESKDYDNMEVKLEISRRFKGIFTN